MKDVCVFGVKSNNIEKYVIGTVLLQNYLNAFDFSTKNVGLAVSKTNVVKLRKVYSGGW